MQSLAWINLLRLMPLELQETLLITTSNGLELNIQAIIRHFGGTMDDIVKITQYITDLTYRPLVARPRDTYLGTPGPVVQTEPLPRAAGPPVDADAPAPDTEPDAPPVVLPPPSTAATK